MKNKILLLLPFIGLVFIAGTIDPNNLLNYANQDIPNYILKDNSGNNSITNEGATLGRVLFYDRNLSLNNTISCASCHQQEFAFSDPSIQSSGIEHGLTERHSMRLINTRFADEVRFFWNERANTLEDQTTQPIQDHIEMGFSRAFGQPGLDSLLRKLENIGYYNTLFSLVYGDSSITEVRIQNALAQFVRSIQSFDSKYDIGRAQVPNDQANFPNYTPQENLGKQLFLAPPPQGGAGCQGCHRAPEFDIDPNSQNNGVIAVAGSTTLIDTNNTRAPSLRDLFNPNGQLNGPLMHNGNFQNMMAVIDHYNSIPINSNNTNLDPRLMVGPNGQNLQLTQNEKGAIIAFLRTLTGSNVYTDERWSDPFEANGEITIVGQTVSIRSVDDNKVDLILYPNPSNGNVWIKGLLENFNYNVIDMSGKIILSGNNQDSSIPIDISMIDSGYYIIQISTDQSVVSKRIYRL